MCNVSINKDTIVSLAKTNGTLVSHFTHSMGKLFDQVKNRDRRQDELRAGVTTRFADAEEDYSEQVNCTLHVITKQLNRLCKKAKKRRLQLTDQELFDYRGQCIAKSQDIEDAVFHLIDEFGLAA